MFANALAETALAETGPVETVLLVAVLMMAGLGIGPLLGIVADRAVDRLRPVPEHRCTTCETGLGPASLIPVVSWRQRCPSCGNHKGMRYPLIDAAAAVTFGLLGLRFGLDWQLWPYLALAAVLVVLSIIDAETHLLPNIIVWPSIWAALFTILVLSGQVGDSGRMYAALWGGVIFGGFIGAVHLVHEEGMGRGDVKLSLLLGLFIGWLQPDPLVAVSLILYALVLASFSGAVVGLTLRRLHDRRGEIPFGPALCGAALVIIIASPTLTARL